MRVLLLILFGIASGTMMYENVIFQKLNDITTTRSRWTITLVIDLEPYYAFLNKCHKDLGTVTLVLRDLIQKHLSVKAPKIVHLFTKLDADAISLNDTLTALGNNFKEYQRLIRPKRSVLPFVGRALSFLFGVVSDTDLSGIKRNVQNLANNQERLSHVVEDSLTILNTSRVEIAGNRNKINEILGKLRSVDRQITNVTHTLNIRIVNLEWATATYLQIELAIQEIRDTVHLLTSYLEHIQLQLNMLSLGHMSPSTITPTSLLTILNDVKVHLPPRFKLPDEPHEALWDYYKHLKCSTILYDNKILVLVNVPLLDTNGHFEIYRVHNLPVPITINEINKQAINSVHNMLSQYRLETTLIAVNAKRTQYLLLKESESNTCTHPMSKYCFIESPVYPINLSKLCVVALFAQNAAKVKLFCDTDVRPRALLPQATYLAKGQWAIASTDVLVFTVVCKEDVRQTKTFTVNPPLGLIRLNETCSASNDHLTLLPYYHRETYHAVKDNFQNLINNANISEMLILEPLRIHFDNLTFAKVPAPLKDVDSIPMNHLVQQLQDIDTTMVNMDTGPVSHWEYFLAVIVIIIAIIVGIVMYKKFLRTWLAKLVGDRTQPDVTSDMEMVPVHTESASNTFRQQVASAPLLPDAEKAEAPRQSTTAPVIRHLYPGLDSSPREQ